MFLPLLYTYRISSSELQDSNLWYPVSKAGALHPDMGLLGTGVFSQRNNAGTVREPRRGVVCAGPPVATFRGGPDCDDTARTKKVDQDFG